MVLPGVGAFDHGMENLRSRGLVDLLSELVQGKKLPMLGICLGMQLFGRGSEEGRLPGLGWIASETVRFRFDPVSTRLRIPHMGWNHVHITDSEGLFRGFEDEPRFYFVHSYHVVCDRTVDALATCHYGHEFTCAVRRGNIFGTQFHPEKSHRYGMLLLKNFAALTGAC